MNLFASDSLNAPKPWFAAPACDPPSATSANATLLARSGATATITEEDGNERIEVRDATRQLLFKIDPATGRVTIQAEAGNLALSAPSGDIELSAGGALRFRSDREVCIDAGESLRVHADKAAIGIADATYSGTRLRTKLADVKHIVERLETVADRLFERAKSAYRQVEGLSQLRAGRVRTLAEGAYFVRAETTSLEARDDVRIDGKHIHLG